MTKHNDEVVFAVSTGFGANTQQPYVQVLIEAADWMTQMPPEAARELALNLLTAAESADGDGFLMSFFKERLGVTDVNQRAGVLIDFREYREVDHAAADSGHTGYGCGHQRACGKNYVIVNRQTINRRRLRQTANRDPSICAARESPSFALR